MTSTMRLRPSPNEEARILQEERERRRKLRLMQVREQSKRNATKIREAVRSEKEKVLNELALEMMTKHELERIEKLKELEETYQQNLKNIGQAHRDAENFDSREGERTLKHKQNLKLATKRHQKALQQLHEEQERRFEEENRHIMARQTALELEKLRSNEVASRPPPPPDPVKQLELPKVKPFKLTGMNAFSATHYHISRDVHVERATSEEQKDAFQAADEEEQEINMVQNEKKISFGEQREKARLRYLSARKKEGLKQDYDQLLHDLSDLQHKDVHKRQQVVAKIPKQIFVPPHQRAEQRLDLQHFVEREFEEMYMAATDFAGDLSLALDPHPVPEMPESSDGLDLTVDAEELSDEEPIPNASTLRHSQAHTTTGQQTSEAEVTLQSREKETGLWKLLTRIKSQRDSWITKGSKEKPKSERPPQRDETVDDKVAKPMQKDAAEDISSDEDKVSDVSVQQPARLLLTPPTRIDRGVSAKSGASEVSSLTQYTLAPSDGVAEPISASDQEKSVGVPAGHEWPTETAMEAVPAGTTPQIIGQDDMLMHPMEKAAEIRKAKIADHSNLSAFLEERRHQQVQFDLQNQQIQTEISQRQADLLAKNEELERKIKEIAEKKKVLQAAYMRQLQEPVVPSEPPQDRTRHFVESVAQIQGVCEPSMMSQSDGRASLSSMTLSLPDGSGVESVHHGVADLPISATSSAGQVIDGQPTQQGMPIDRVKAYQAAALLRRQRNQSLIGASQLKERTDQLLMKHTELQARFRSDGGQTVGYFPSTQSSSTDTSETTSSSGPPSEFAAGVQVAQPKVQAPLTFQTGAPEGRVQPGMSGLVSQFQRPTGTEPDVQVPLSYGMAAVERMALQDSSSVANQFQQVTVTQPEVQAPWMYRPEVLRERTAHDASDLTKQYQQASSSIQYPQSFVPGHAQQQATGPYYSQEHISRPSVGLAESITTIPEGSTHATLQEQKLPGATSEYRHTSSDSSSLQEQTLTSSGEDAVSPREVPLPSTLGLEFLQASRNIGSSNLQELDATLERQAQLRSLLSGVLQQRETLSREYHQKQMTILAERQRLVQQQQEMYSPVGGIAVDTQVARDAAAEWKEMNEVQQILNDRFQSLQLDEDEEELQQERLQGLDQQRSRPPVKQQAADLSGLRYHELSTIVEMETPINERVVSRVRDQLQREQTASVAAESIAPVAVCEVDLSEGEEISFEQAMARVGFHLDDYGRVTALPSSKVSQQASTQVQPGMGHEVHDMASSVEMQQALGREVQPSQMQQADSRSPVTQVSHTRHHAWPSILSSESFGHVTDTSYQSSQSYQDHVSSPIDQAAFVRRQDAALAVSHTWPDSEQLGKVDEICYRSIDESQLPDTASPTVHAYHPGAIQHATEQIAAMPRKQQVASQGFSNAYQTSTQDIYQPSAIETKDMRKKSTLKHQAPEEVVDATRRSFANTLRQSNVYSPRESYQTGLPSASIVQQVPVTYSPAVVSGSSKETERKDTQDVGSFESPFQQQQPEMWREGRSKRPLFEAAVQVHSELSKGSFADSSLSDVSFHTPDISRMTGRRDVAGQATSNVQYGATEVVQNAAHSARTLAVNAARHEASLKTTEEQGYARTMTSELLTRGPEAPVETHPMQVTMPYSRAVGSEIPSHVYASLQRLGIADLSDLVLQTSPQSAHGAAIAQQSRENMSEISNQSPLTFKTAVQVSDEQVESVTPRDSKEAVSYYSAVNIPHTSVTTQDVASYQGLYNTPVQYGRPSWQDVAASSDVSDTSYQAAHGTPLTKDLHSLQRVSRVPYTASTVEQVSLGAEAASLMDNINYQAPSAKTQEHRFAQPADISSLPQVPYQSSMTVAALETQNAKLLPASSVSTTSTFGQAQTSTLDVAADLTAGMRKPDGALNFASVREASNISEGHISNLSGTDIETAPPPKMVAEESNVKAQVYRDQRKQYLAQTDVSKPFSHESVQGVTIQVDDDVQTSMIVGQKYGKATVQEIAESYRTPRGLQLAQVDILEQLHGGSVAYMNTRDEGAYATEGMQYKPMENAEQTSVVAPQTPPISNYQAMQNFERGQQRGFTSDLKIPAVDFLSLPRMTQAQEEELLTPPASTRAPHSDLPQTVRQARTVLSTMKDQGQPGPVETFSPMQEDTSMVSESSSKTWAEILAADQAIGVKQQEISAVKRATVVSRPEPIEGVKLSHQLHSPPSEGIQGEPEKFKRLSSTPAKSRLSSGPKSSETPKFGLEDKEEETGRKPISQVTEAQERHYPSSDWSYQPLDLDISANTTATTDVGVLPGQLPALNQTSDESRSSSIEPRMPDDQASGIGSNYDGSLTQHSLDSTSAVSASQASPQQSTSEEDESKPRDDLTLRSRMSVASGLLHPVKKSGTAGSATELEVSDIHEGELTQHLDSSSLPQISLDATKEHSVLQEQRLSGSLTSLIQGNLSQLQESSANLPHGVRSYLSQLSRSLSDGKIPPEHLPDLLHNLESMNSLHLSALGGSSTPRSWTQHSIDSQTKSLSSLTPISQASLLQRSMLSMTPGSSHSLTQHSITSLTPYSMTHSTTLHSTTPLAATLSEGTMSHYTLPSPIWEPGEASQFSNADATPFLKAGISKRSVSFASPLSRDSLTQHSLSRDSPLHQSQRSHTRDSLSQHSVQNTLSRELSNVSSLSKESPTQSVSTLPRDTLSQHSVRTSLLDMSSVHSQKTSLSRESLGVKARESYLSSSSPSQHSLPDSMIKKTRNPYLQDIDQERSKGESLSSDSSTQHVIRASLTSTPSQHSDEATPSRIPSRAAVSGSAAGSLSRYSSEGSLTHHSLDPTLSRGSLSQHSLGYSPLAQYTLEMSLSRDSPTRYTKDTDTSLSKSSPTQYAKDMSVSKESLHQHSYGTTLSRGALSQHSFESSTSASLSQGTLQSSFPRDVSSEHSNGLSLSKDSPTQHSMGMSLSRAASMQHRSLAYGSDFSKSLSQHQLDPTISQHLMDTLQSASTASLPSQVTAQTDQLTQYSVKTTPGVASQQQNITGAASINVGSSLSDGTISVPTQVSQLTQHSESVATPSSFGSMTQQQILQYLTQISMASSLEQCLANQQLSTAQVRERSLQQQSMSPSQFLEKSSNQEHTSGSDSSGSLSQHSMAGDDIKGGDTPSHHSPALSPISIQNLSGQSGQGAQFSKIAMKILQAQHSRWSSPSSSTGGSNASSPNSSQGAAASGLIEKYDKSGQLLTQYNLSDLTAKSLTQRSLPDMTGKSLTQYEISNLSDGSASSTEVPHASGRSLTQYTIDSEPGKSLAQYEASGTTGWSLAQHSIPDLSQQSLPRAEISTNLTGRSLTQYGSNDITGRSLTQYVTNMTGKSLTQYYGSDASGTSLIHRNISDIPSDLSQHSHGQDVISQYNASSITGRSLTQRSIAGASLTQHGISYAAPYSLAQSSSSSGSTLLQGNVTGVSITQHPYVSSSSLTQHDLADPSSRSLQQHPHSFLPSGGHHPSSVSGATLSSHSVDNVAGNLSQYSSVSSRSKSHQGSKDQVFGDMFSQYYLRKTEAGLPAQHHLDSSPGSLVQNRIGNDSARSGSLLLQQHLESSSLLQSAENSRHYLSGNRSDSLSGSGASPDWAKIKTPISHVVKHYIGEKSGSMERSIESSSESPLSRMRTPGTNSSVDSSNASANYEASGSGRQSMRRGYDDGKPSTSITADEMNDPKDDGILEEPNLTFASDISDVSRPTSPYKKQSARPPADSSFPHQAESPESRISHSLLSFEKHELSLSDADQTGPTRMTDPSEADDRISRYWFSRDDESSRAESPMPGTSQVRPESSEESAHEKYGAAESQDDDKVYIVETPSKGGFQQGLSLQEAFERRKADFIKSSEARKAEAKTKAAVESSTQSKYARAAASGSMRSTLSAWKRSRALNAAAKSDDVTRSPVKSSVVKTAGDRKKNEKLMKQRTKRLYIGLEEVKSKMLEEEKKKQYALNREKAQDYKQKYQQKIRKKWDK